MKSILLLASLSFLLTACTGNAGKPPLPGNTNSAQQSAVQGGLQYMDALDDSTDGKKDTAVKK